MQVKDQMNRHITLSGEPKRIVSLVPSQTQLLADLGLEDEVVGITTFCVHPQHWRKEKVIVGGTKKVHFDRIAALKPDLIIGNKEENTKTDIEKLAKDYPVYMSDVSNLSQALEMIGDLGKICGKADKAEEIQSTISRNFAGLSPELGGGRRTLYFIWMNPWMVAGEETFIDDMLQRCGLFNVAERTRYPELTIDQIISRQPQRILLSSEPFPFKEKHIAELQKLLPQAKITLVNGEYFSWYGSMLMDSVGYFEKVVDDRCR